MGGESEGEGVPEGGQAAEEGNEGQEGDGRRDDDEVAGKGHVRRHARTLYLGRTSTGWYVPCSHTATMEER
jgi:hypothetical protein